MTNKVFDHIKKMSLGLSQGEKLPSERDLANKYSVARNTIIAILGELEGEGIIWRKAKSGWYVSPPRFIYSPQKIYTFDGEGTGQNFDSNVKLLSLEIDKLKTFNQQLGTDKAQVITRVKSLNFRPVMIEKSYVADATFPNLKQYNLTKSLTKLFASVYNFNADKIEIEVKSHTLNPTESNILLCSVGLPSLVIKRTITSQQNIKQIDIEIWRFDAITLSLENL